MKRFLVFFTCLLFVVLTTGCNKSADTAKKEAFFAADNEVITAENVNTELDTFVLGDTTGEHRDRTSFTVAEHSSAKYIEERLKSFGYENAAIQSVEEEAISVNGTAIIYTTYNVVARYNEGKEREVLIGASYDNMFSGLTELGVPATKSEGIADNATGASALLCLAKAFCDENPTLDYTVTFVFYGASKIDNIGSRKFADSYASVKNILLCVNFSVLTGEKLYIFADDVKTNHEKLFLANANRFATKFSTLPATTPVLPPTSVTVDLGYSHYGLVGDHAAFFVKDVPCINIFGGDYESFNYYTPIYDTYESYRSESSNNGTAAADAANLLYSTLTATDFSAVATTFTNKKSYSFFTGDAVIYIVQIGIIILSAIALIIVVKRLEKKYPRVPRRMPKVKIAVFGMDYENKGDSDIYVDLKPVDPFENDEATDPFENSSQTDSNNEESKRDDVDNNSKNQ